MDSLTLSCYRSWDKLLWVLLFPYMAEIEYWQHKACCNSTTTTQLLGISHIVIPDNDTAARNFPYCHSTTTILLLGISHIVIPDNDNLLLESESGIHLTISSKQI